VLTAQSCGAIDSGRIEKKETDLSLDESIDVSVDTGDSYRVKYEYVKIFSDYFRSKKPKYVSTIKKSETEFLDKFFAERSGKSKEEERKIFEKYRHKMKILFNKSQKSQIKFHQEVLYPFVKRMTIDKYLSFLTKYPKSSFVPEAKLKLVEFYLYIKDKEQAAQWVDDIIKNHPNDITYEIKREYFGKKKSRKYCLKLYTSGKKTSDIAQYYKSEF